MPPSAAQMLEALRKRDPHAVEELVREHHRQLRGFVAALSMDVGATDDLAQEVFLRAIQQLSKVDDLNNLPLFLRGIARNVVREHNRKRSRTLQRYTRLVEDAYAAEPAESTVSQSLSSLRKCMARLSAKSRELLTLKYEVGCSAEEIGDRTNRKPGTVRVALLRLRESLLKCMRTCEGMSPEALP